MPDYSKTVIYCIQKDDQCYWGHTTDFASRKCHHKPTNNQCVSRHIAEDANIYVVEHFPCKNVEEAKARERWWIETHPHINKQIPGRTREEWYIENRSYLLAYQKNYRDKNKERLSEEKKVYYQTHKSRIDAYRKVYRETHREQIKQSNKKQYEKNKESRAIAHAIWYSKNSTKVLARKRVPVKCERCGTMSTQRHLKRHQMTQKCLNLPPT